MTNNYFKVKGHGRADQVFFFDDRDAVSTPSAFTRASGSRRTFTNKGALQVESISVFSRPRVTGAWSTVPVIGDAT